MKQKHAGNSYKKVPSYWWDFDKNCQEIIVESDHKNWKLLARIKVLENSDDEEIKLAEKIIDELKSGRLSHKECYKKYVENKDGTFLSNFLGDITYK